MSGAWLGVTPRRLQWSISDDSRNAIEIGIPTRDVSQSVRLQHRNNQTIATEQFKSLTAGGPQRKHLPQIPVGFECSTEELRQSLGERQ